MSNHEEHEGHEGQENHKKLATHDERRLEQPMPSPWLRMRLPSPLPPETESVMTETIGCAIAVHRALGPGFLERIYRNAMYIELEARRLAYQAEQPVKVVYRGVEIPGQRVDLIVEGLVVVELKSVMHIDQIHRAQVLSYMKTTGLKAGLLINFRAATLRQGLHRFVL
jgi:GxxExxY protein